ncbi:MAG: YbhB/YbcL family Raf kinase inhibitor-like protein [Deltaproteobacteria bacterium]|nr:YbhB/YbcL family Raf kinase inhibitor-like protein [Deltaproteobacteria bacterium]
MKVHSKSFEDNSPIPREFAFCMPDPESQATFSTNRSPHISWSDAPEGTRSFAIICVDPDVPSVGDSVNVVGETVSGNIPRVDFYHWVLVDIPSGISELAEGADSEGITTGGKPVGRTPNGVRGINDYTKWFAGDEQMRGHYGGYDGPCPPWNDELLHHYVFRVFALDVDNLGLSGPFAGQEALRAMEGHILAEARYTGTYTQNPHVSE